MLDALRSGEPGDVALASRLLPQSDRCRPRRRPVAASSRCRRRARPASRSIDIAYQGFGRGLDEDAYGVRLMLDSCDEVIIAQSCDKNFSVYRDRVGSLWIKSRFARDDGERDGARLPDRPRDVVDAARPWRRGGSTSSSTIPSSASAGWSSSPQCAIASMRFVSASPLPTRASPSSGGSSGCSRCFRCRRSRC